MALVVLLNHLQTIRFIITFFDKCILAPYRIKYYITLESNVTFHNITLMSHFITFSYKSFENIKLQNVQRHNQLLSETCIYIFIYFFYFFTVHVLLTSFQLSGHIDKTHFKYKTFRKSLSNSQKIKVKIQSPNP